MKRRDFVKLSSLGTTAIILDGCKTKDSAEKKAIVYPVTKDNIKVIKIEQDSFYFDNVKSFYQDKYFNTISGGKR